jgi:hypothetical protein
VEQKPPLKQTGLERNWQHYCMYTTKFAYSDGGMAVAIAAALINGDEGFKNWRPVATSVINLSLATS